MNKTEQEIRNLIALLERRTGIEANYKDDFFVKGKYAVYVFGVFAFCYYWDGMACTNAKCYQIEKAIELDEFINDFIEAWQ